MLEVKMEFKRNKEVPPLMDLISLSQDLNAVDQAKSLMVKKDKERLMTQFLDFLKNEAKEDLVNAMLHDEISLSDTLYKTLAKFYGLSEEEVSILNTTFGELSSNLNYSLSSVISSFNMTGVFTTKEIRDNLLPEDSLEQYLLKHTKYSLVPDSIKSIFYPIFLEERIATFDDPQDIAHNIQENMNAVVNSGILQSVLPSNFTEELFTGLNLGNEETYHGDEGLHVPDYDFEDLEITNIFGYLVNVAAPAVDKEYLYSLLDDLNRFFLRYNLTFDNEKIYSNGMPSVSRFLNPFSFSTIATMTTEQPDALVSLGLLEEPVEIADTNEQKKFIKLLEENYKKFNDFFETTVNKEFLFEAFDKYNSNRFQRDKHGNYIYYRDFTNMANMVEIHFGYRILSGDYDEEFKEQTGEYNLSDIYLKNIIDPKVSYSHSDDRINLLKEILIPKLCEEYPDKELIVFENGIG